MYEIYTWEEPGCQILLRDGPLEKWWGGRQKQNKKNLQEIINKKNISLRILAKKYMPKEKKKPTFMYKKDILHLLKSSHPLLSSLF